MKNRISFALTALLLIALSLPSFIFAQSAQTPDRKANDTSRFPPNVAPRAARRVARDPAKTDATAGIEHDFAEALTLVQENYVDGNNIDYNTVFKSSIIGMLRSLDPHSNYYDSKEFDEMRTEQRSEYFGIGASISDRRIGNKPDDKSDTYIMSTFENSPAARAGLRYGDRIVAVDGQSMRGKPSGEVRDKLRGPRGVSVKITVERASNNQPETVEITRDAVPRPSVPDAYMIRPGVGYIDMTQSFAYSTSDELQAALNKLQAGGMTSLVLDLRNNPGGFLDQSIKVASKFLQPGQLVLTQKGRNRGSDRPYQARTENGVTPDATTPLVILINQFTASASEIVAGAVQDHDRGLIVGEASFGKGLVQSIIPLEYNAGLTLTSAKYYTPSGRLIQRDYSNVGLYDYTYRGGLGRQAEEDARAAQTAPSTGAESRTDGGHVVYSGGGISPDDAVRSRVPSITQLRLLNVMFGFVRELVNGRISGFDSYKVQRAIEFNHNLQATNFPVTDALYKAFKDYVATRTSVKVTPAQLDRNRDYIQRQLRHEVITAAYGTVTAQRVLVADDPQTLKAIEVLPRARDLAMNATRGRTSSPGQTHLNLFKTGDLAPL
ncbi:MAG: S41 family peptidase [Pyrinomonadaceae bacterium]|nr:S41 family peptidase [Pyrinomonadaceae bacterium]